MKKEKSPSTLHQVLPLIDETESLSKILNFHPDFQSCWQRSREFLSPDEAPNIGYVDLAWEIFDLLCRDPHIDFRPLMRTVEEILTRGTQGAQQIIAEFFIQALLDVSDHNSAAIAPVLRLMGPLARDYARQWNRMLGEQSLGLEKQK